MTPPAARILLALCLALGILAEILFDQGALGLNVPIATGILLLAMTVIGRRRGRPERADLWLPVVAMVAAVLVAIRTDAPIVELDLGLALAATAVWAFAAAGIAVTRQTAVRVAVLGAWAAMSVLGGATAIAVRATADGPLTRARVSAGHWAPVLRGALIAVPVLIVFAALLASADAVFARLVDGILALPLDPYEPARRTLLALAFAFLVAGPLALVAGFLPLDIDRLEDQLDGAAAVRSSRVGERAVTETVMVLGTIAAVFGVFVVVQFGYLFGGGEGIAATGLPYSTYARQGYFQLVAVVGLAGALALAGILVAGRARSVRFVAMVLLLLTAAILVSAAVRLSLYLQAYGWTELRFYVLASIAWLAIGGGATIVLLARDRMRWVLHALAMAAIAVTIGVSALGPQAFVTSENVARVLDPSLVPPDGETGLDLGYLLTLDDDAVPALVAVVDSLPATDRSTVLEVLRGRRGEIDAEAGSVGWAGWNLGRERARAALANLPDR
jgi:hypothetical protein